MLYFYALIPVNWMRAVSNFNYMYYQHCIKLTQLFIFLFIEKDLIKYSEGNKT